MPACVQKNTNRDKQIGILQKIKKIKFIFAFYLFVLFSKRNAKLNDFLYNSIRL